MIRDGKWCYIKCRRYETATFNATVRILFMPESTEGISEGQTTAMSGKKD